MDSLTRGPCLLSLGLLTLSLPGVSAESDLAPVIASGAVASFLLLLLIIIIVFSSSANKWVKSLMKSNGKVKMPKRYFEKKKEVKRRLMNESMRSSRMTQDTYVTPKPASHANGNVSPPAVPVADKESMVQGWNQNTMKVYEERGYTMELGDEHDEEFHIETSIVDNEVLDVGPYKSMGSTNAKPVDGNVYANPYLYTNNDRVTVIRSSEATGIVSTMSNEMHEIPLNSNSTRGNSADTPIEDRLIKL